MPFDAIVRAPALRIGTRVNIAEADQIEGTRPAKVGVGAEIRLRLGVCCPDRSNGRVVAFSRQHPDTLVLAIGADSWTLRRGDEAGVTTPGLVSEVWYVADRITRAASPPDHSVPLSSGSATLQG